MWRKPRPRCSEAESRYALRNAAPYLKDDRLNDMHYDQYTRGRTERNMYSPPDCLFCSLLQQCKKCKDQEKHPCQLTCYHARSAARKDTVCQSRNEQDDAISCVKAGNAPDPGVPLRQLCAFHRCKRTENE